MLRYDFGSLETFADIRTTKQKKFHILIRGEVLLNQLMEN